jgi:hypothetical protein
MMLVTRNNATGREFFVVTELQRAARRPGGPDRNQALQAANDSINRIKSRFGPWLETEIDELRLLVAAAPSAKRSERARLVKALRSHIEKVVDVAATMDYAMVSFIARNIQMICDAMDDGAEWDNDVIVCHIDALHLGAQRKYSKLKPQDLPELSDGLQRIIKATKLKRKDSGKTAESTTR